jgi:hypothetical protein
MDKIKTKILKSLNNLNELLKNNKSDLYEFIIPSEIVTDEMVECYMADIEHGFQHGLAAYVVASLIFPELHESDIASILLHDFYKASTGIARDHDHLLVKYFSYLTPETYIHSNPPSSHNYSPLVIADREELFRYENCEWVNSEWKHREEMSDKMQDVYNFYRLERRKMFKLKKYKSVINSIYTLLSNYLLNK